MMTEYPTCSERAQRAKMIEQTTSKQRASKI
jgi:hypothetical protein